MQDNTIAGGGRQNSSIPPQRESKNHIGLIILLVLLAIVVLGIAWFGAARSGVLPFPFDGDRLGQDGNPGPVNQKFAVVGFIESIDTENFTIGLLEEETGVSYMIDFVEENGMVIARGNAIDFEEMGIGTYVSVTASQPLGEGARTFETFRINLLPNTGGNDFSVPAGSR